MQFTSTLISFIVLAMSFGAMAAPVPVPVAGTPEEAKRALIGIRVSESCIIFCDNQSLIFLGPRKNLLLREAKEADPLLCGIFLRCHSYSSLARSWEREGGLSERNFRLSLRDWIFLLAGIGHWGGSFTSRSSYLGTLF
jgi:hypothetical protein